MKSEVTDSGRSWKILTGYDICDEPMSAKTKQYIDELMVIDTECYGGEEKGEDCVYVGDASGYYSRFGYREGPDGQMHLDPTKGCVDNIIAIANEKGTIIGYINYLTVQEDLYKKLAINPDIEEYLEDPSSRDDGITGDQLKQWTKDGRNDLFILSVTIAKNYQDGDVVVLLTNEFLAELQAKEEAGYHITSLSGDTVSEHGERFMKRIHCNHAKGEDGVEMILPCPESDESGQPVTIVTQVPVQAEDGRVAIPLVLYGVDPLKDNEKDITRKDTEATLGAGRKTQELSPKPAKEEPKPMNFDTEPDKDNHDDEYQD